MNIGSRDLIAQANIAIGDILSVNSSGVMDTSGGTDNDEFMVGIALEASAAVGDYIQILVTPRRLEAN